MLWLWRIIEATLIFLFEGWAHGNVTSDEKLRNCIIRVLLTFYNVIPHYCHVAVAVRTGLFVVKSQSMACWQRTRGQSWTCEEEWRTDGLVVCWIVRTTNGWPVIWKHRMHGQRVETKQLHCISWEERGSMHRRKIHNLNLLTNLVRHNPSVPTASSQVDVLAAARSPNVRGAPFQKRKSGLTYWLIEWISPFLSFGRERGREGRKEEWQTFE